MKKRALSTLKDSKVRKSRKSKSSKFEEALDWGSKEAKDMTDKAPIMVKEGVDKKTADELKAKLEATGERCNEEIGVIMGFMNTALEKLLARQ